MMGIEWLTPGLFFGSMLFALIGVAIFRLCFVITDKLTSYDLWADLVDKRNTALAIAVGSNLHCDRAHHLCRRTRLNPTFRRRFPKACARACPDAAGGCRPPACGAWA